MARKLNNRPVRAWLKKTRLIASVPVAVCSFPVSHALCGVRGTARRLDKAPKATKPSMKGTPSRLTVDWGLKKRR